MILSPQIRSVSIAACAAGLLLGETALAHEGGTPHQHGDQTPLPAPSQPAATVLQPQPTKQPATSDTAPPGESAARESVEPAAPPPTGKDWSSPGSRQRTISDSGWRKRNREGSHNDWFTPGHFTAELRFAPYAWQVTDTPEYPDPLNDSFGTFFDGNSFYFGLELDWLPLHIPYVGSAGAAFGWGWASVSGKAQTASGADTETETSLTVFPMHASGVIRIDGPLRRWGAPIVPHAKIGFGFAPWDASTDGNDGGAGGTSAGLHLGLGASLALNAFDPSAGRTMYEDTGIRYAYLWAEWMYDDLGTIGRSDPPQLRAGTSTVALGLALDW